MNPPAAASEPKKSNVCDISYKSLGKYFLNLYLW